MNDTIKLLLYFPLLIAIGIIGAMVIYSAVSHTVVTRTSSWDKGAKNTPFSKMVSSGSIVSGELNHLVWSNSKITKAFQSKLGSKDFDGLKIITSFIDYYTLIEPRTNKGTSMLKWLVCGEIEIYLIPEEINFMHFRIIDNNIVVFHSHDTKMKGEEIIIKGIKPIVEQFETKFKKLLKKADGPFKGKDVMNKFMIRTPKNPVENVWEQIKNDERKILEKEINKLIGV